MRDYLTLIEILSIHAIVLQRYGGADGIRDMGALEATLYRPQSGYYTDIIQEAAALMESLAINHPFIDGNKRVAFAAVDVFLRINGYRIVQQADPIFKMLMNLFEQGNFDIEHLESWLRVVVQENNG